jgi:mono/diheme cytochrome c family protein
MLSLILNHIKENDMKALIVGMVVALLFTAVLWGCAETATTSERWYTPEQVAAGKPLYAKYCAGCHGEQGQGGLNWDRPKADGSYPPQPLNGSGHSWHHSLSSQETTIAQGGTHPGATMPGFADVVDKQERLAIIAAFQDFWDDKTYAGWLR